jgi:glycine cleavage system transcriptional repressor
MTDLRYVLTAVGPDRPGIVAGLSGFLTGEGFNLEDSRMATLGGEFALILLLSKTRLDARDPKTFLSDLESLTGMTLTMRETTLSGGRPGIPYLVRGYAMDHPGIVHALAHEIATLGANIEELETSTRPAPVTGTPLFDVRMRVSLPLEVSVHQLRKRLTEVADQRNIDISVEPTPV